MPPPSTPDDSRRLVRLVNVSSANLFNRWYYTPAVADDAAATSDDGGDPSQFLETFDDNYHPYHDLILLLLGRAHAVPLQRQNAIRRTNDRLQDRIRQMDQWMRDIDQFSIYRARGEPPQVPTPPTRTSCSKEALAATQEVASSLAAELERIIASIEQFPHYQGILPLFDLSKVNERRYGQVPSPADDNLFANLEDLLDDFLWQRRLGLAWGDPVPPRKRSRNRAPAPLPRKRSKMAIVRPCDVNEPTPMDTDDHNEPNRTYTLLSREEKDAILSVQPCAFFQPALVFSMYSSPTLVPFAMVLTRVDFDRAVIDGFFRFDRLQFVDQLQLFQRFLCGPCQIPKAMARLLTVTRKLAVISKLLVHPKVKQALTKHGSQLQIPILGRIVDFKHHDLRFLPTLARDSRLRYKTFHLARIKSNMVKMQMLEWMHVEPFVQFKELYFLTTIAETCHALQHFETVHEAHDVVRRAEGLRGSVNELVSTLSFCRDVDLDETPLGRRTTTNSYHVEFFKQWNRGLAEVLCDQLTTTNALTTLINLNLNYILFTLDVDISTYCDRVLEAVVAAGAKSGCDDVVECYRDVYRQIVADECHYEATGGRYPSFGLRYHTRQPVTQAVLLCLLNRKTGEVQFHNTLPFSASRPNHTDVGLSFTRLWTALGRDRLFSPSDDEVDDFSNVPDVANDDETGGDVLIGVAKGKGGGGCVSLCELL